MCPTAVDIPELRARIVESGLWAKYGVPGNLATKARGQFVL